MLPMSQPVSVDGISPTFSNANQPLLWLALFLSLAVSPISLFGQKAPPSTNLFFNQLVEYQFVDTDGKKHDFQLLLNTKTGLWGFDKTMSNAIGWGEDLAFITAAPDGTYTFYGQDPAKGKIIFTQRIKDVSPRPEVWQKGRKLYFDALKPINKPRRFQGLAVQDYTTQPAADGSVERLSVAQVSFNTYPIYLFNTLDGDAKLPCYNRLDFSRSLSPQELLVESVLTFPADGTQSTLKLTFYTPTEYYFNTKGYKAAVKK
jgi:hypothetical protein